MTDWATGFGRIEQASAKLKVGDKRKDGWIDKRLAWMVDGGLV
jgi:hypothetical protein